MDVCPPKAIDMRVNKGKTIEGSNLVYLEFNQVNNKESFPEQMMTFPYMSNAALCDGCMICVKECPTLAIDIENNIDIQKYSKYKVNLKG